MAEANQPPPEVILFDLKNFHGAHKHIFQKVDDLRKVDSDTTQFADKTESIVVVRGTWLFFEHHTGLGQKWELGPGGYPDVVKQHIMPNQISSLEPKPASPSPPPS
jgi:hypothetical protein